MFKEMIERGVVVEMLDAQEAPADGAEVAPRSIRSNTQVSFHIWWLLESCDKLPDTDHLATFGPFSEFIK